MQPTELICLRASAPQFDPAKGAEGLPGRILVLPWGQHATAQGQVICNDTTMRLLASYNAAKNWDRTALDFEHSAVPGSPTYKGEPVKVAGYGKLELVPGEGIYMLMSSWTNEGKEFAAGGHYGDLSPVVKVNDKNEVIGLHSVALCRHGATPGLTFLRAPAPGQTAPTQGKAKPTPKRKPKPSRRMTTPPKTAEDLMAAIAELLGLDADAAPADILDALTTKLKDAAEPDDDEAGDKAETKALSAGLAEIKNLLKAQDAKLNAQDAKLKLLSSGVETNEVSAILKQAAAEGKVVPSIAAKTLAAADLKLLCAELPSTVPMALRTPDASTLLLSATAATAAPVNTELAAIDTLTGVSEEDVKKYLKK